MVYIHVLCVHITGFVEYNSLRSKGYTRSLSVLAIKAESRAKYAKMGEQKMLKMITPMSKL